MSIPTTADNVFFDTLSFSAGGQTVTIDGNADCLSMDWSLATNSPTLTGVAGFTLTVAGTAFTIIDAMTYSFAGPLVYTNTGGITIALGDVAKTFGTVTFTGTVGRTINVNGNGGHSLGRITIGNNSTINWNGTGTKTYNGYFTGNDVISNITGNSIFSDTLQTGNNNSLFLPTTSTNSFQTVQLGDMTSTARSCWFFGTNTFNGTVTTGSNVQNTDRNRFYNSTFQAKLTMPAPNGRGQFRNDCTFNDTVLLGGNNSSARFYGRDTFNSVALFNGWYLHFTESNVGGTITVFNDSVLFGFDTRYVSSQGIEFNGPVNFEGNDTETQDRRFCDNGGVANFNDKVYFNNGAGTANRRITFDRTTNFNDDVFIGNNTFMYFGDNGGTIEFNDTVAIGNSNDLYFERNATCDSIFTIGNNNTITFQRNLNCQSPTTIGNQNNLLGLGTIDFAELTVGELNTINWHGNVDFNRDAVFGDTNIVSFCLNTGEVDVFDHLSFGIANTLTFNRRFDHGPGTTTDSILIGRLTSAEFLSPASNNVFENVYIDNEARMTFRNGTNSFRNIVLNDFSTIEFSAGGTNTITRNVTANESCETSPIIRSGTGGSQATLDFTGFAQNWSNVILQDIAVTTTNLLTVDEAVDNGNLSVLDNTTPGPGPPTVGTTIWITNERPGTTLFWVGTDGVASGNFNWTNRFNWSTTSGGNGLLNACLPNAKDNVVFDANSFTAAGQQVIIDASFVVCNDMTWTGVTAGAELVGNTTNTIFILEDLTLDGNMTNNFTGGFEFLADDFLNRTIDPNGIAFGGPLTFNHVGGNWLFPENLSANGTITVKDGTISSAASNANLTITGVGNDLIIENTGIFNSGSGTITIADDLLMSTDAEINILTTGIVNVGDDLIMNDSADFGQAGTGSFTVGGALTISDDAVIDLDTLTFSVGGNFTMNNDAVLTFDSCNGSIGTSFLGNNDVSATFGASVLSMGVDFYMQDNSTGSIAGGTFTCGDDFFLDDSHQFTATNASITVNGDDFFMDDNTVFTGTNVDITVNGDDFYMDDNTTFTGTNADITVNGDDWIIENNATYTTTGGTIYVDDDYRIQQAAVFTANGTTTVNINDNVDINGGTVNANGTFVMDVEDIFDMDGGTFNANACNIFVGLNWDLATAAVFNEGTSTVTFDDDHTDANIITRGENFYNLVINREDSSTDVRILNNNFIIRNNLTILRGEFFDSDENSNGPYQITGNTTGTGSLVVTSKGSLNLGDRNGGSDAPTTFPTGWPALSITLDDSSTVSYIQRATQIVSSLPTYGNLTLTNSNGPVYERIADGVITIEGRLFINDNISFADSGFQIVGNANAGTEFEMDPNAELVLGSATSATTLPSFPSRDWDQRSTINYAAGVPQSVVSITGGGNANSYGNIRFSNEAPTPSLVAKTLTGVIQVRRRIDIEANANLVDAGFQITGNNSGDDVTMEAGSQLTLGTAASNTLFPTTYTSGNIALNANSLVVYNSNVSQNISNVPTYGNIQLSSSAVVEKSLIGTTNINGNLIIDAQNTLNTSPSNRDINIAGNWTNNGDFTANTATVTFTGGNTSTLDGSSITDFYELAMNSTASDSALDLNVRANVTNLLTLTDGVISTTTGNELILFDNATSGTGSNASYVDGPLMKIGNDVFDFAVGDAGKWARIGITDLQNGPAVTDTFVAQYTQGLHPEAFWDSLDYVGDNDDLHNTSVVEYWDLNRLSGTVRPKVTLHWSDNAESYITDINELVIAHYTGSNTWVNEGGTPSGTLPSGAVTTTTNLNSFSPFTFGSTTHTVNPLPIELLSFNVIPNGNVANVYWTTLSEINNDFFEVERSKDAFSFETIATVQGAGNSNVQRDYFAVDDQPYEGISYYRLKQTDYDGSISYSRRVAVSFGSADKQLVVFPNPVQRGGVINFNRNINGSFYDAVGRILSTFTNTNQLNLSDQLKGSYYIRTTEGETVKIMIQ